jgi:hypothetical protein
MTIYKPKIIESYKIYILTKMRNRTNNKVLERKFNLLNLILINIYRLLPEVLNSIYYFLKIVDNYIRKV